MMSTSMELSFQNVLQEVYNRTEMKLYLWKRLLPERYRQDMYGVPGSVLFLTIIFGLIIIWILIWRHKVKRQRNKEKNLFENSERSKLQIEALMREKLETEKELKNSQLQLEKIKSNVAEERSRRLFTEEAISKLEEEFKNYQTENEDAQREIGEFYNNSLELGTENAELVNKLQQVEKIYNEQKMTFNESEKILMELREELNNSQRQNQHLQDSIENHQTQLEEEERSKEENEQKICEREEQVEKMERTIFSLKERVNEIKKDNGIAQQEADIFKESLLQFQEIQKSLKGDEEGDSLDDDDDDGLIKQRKKLQALIDVAEMQRNFKSKEINKNHIMIELEAEKKSRVEAEARIGDLESVCDDERAMKNKTERDLQLRQAKLNVMQEFYAKREVEMQGKLGKEQTARQMHESKLAERGEQADELTETLEMYKKMNADAKQTYEESEKQRKNEIKEYEKKIHQNWLTSRETQRKLEEATSEIRQLRAEASDLTHQLFDAEHHEPFLAPPYLLDGPFDPKLDLFASGSPPPIHGLPREMTPSWGRPTGGRLSPSESIPDLVRRPDRPPSHTFPDKPPSRGPPPNIDFRMSPQSFVHAFVHDEPSPIGTPRRIGPPHIRDGPPPDVQGPYMHRGPPPMGNAPPFVNRRPFMPSMRNESPMREPPFYRDDPPRRDGPPRMEQPGPQQGPMTSSPYMEPHLQPHLGNPLPPRLSSMSLHGNLPQNVKNSGYQPHLGRGDLA